MADKRFTIQDLLPLGVSLNIPPLLGSSSQMPAEDVVKTQEIASLRVHVERAINEIKNFHIFILGWGYTPPPAWPCKPNVVCVCDIMQCATQHYFYLTASLAKKNHVLVILSINLSYQYYVPTNFNDY